jgi:FtsZ-interacting cell division protein ZipA
MYDPMKSGIPLFLFQSHEKFRWVVQEDSQLLNAVSSCTLCRNSKFYTTDEVEKHLNSAWHKKNEEKYFAENPGARERMEREAAQAVLAPEQGDDQDDQASDDEDEDDEPVPASKSSKQAKSVQTKAAKAAAPAEKKAKQKSEPKAEENDSDDDGSSDSDSDLESSEPVRSIKCISTNYPLSFILCAP